MKKFFTKIKDWFVSHKPTKRRIIQLYAALLFNANIKGFVKGTIYTGPLKNVCTPGLNCYSCPGASGACPMGALQNSLASSNKRLPYYMFGIILLYGILLGRWICSWLCPFGLIQELLHKIPTPKLKKNKVTRILSYFKYVILVVFVFIFPLMYMFRKVPLPGFCKYICPAGTLEGAIGLLSNKVNASWFSMLGPIFTWKFILLISFIVACIFIYRFFCRFFCPLGALYGLFNKISFFGIQLDKPKCIDCGKCVTVCKMDINHVGDQECISCGECIDSCPTGAISWKGSKIILHANEINIDENVTPIGTPEYDAAVEEKKAKIAKRNKIIKISVIASLAALLIGALLYYNVFYGMSDDKDEGSTEAPAEQVTGETDTGDGGIQSPAPTVGNKVGNLCPEKTLDTYDGKTFSIAQTKKQGKVTVINFWGTWCTPCVQELPHFNDIASTYADDVSVVVIHSALDSETGGDHINGIFPDTKMIAAMDTANDDYYKALGGTIAYPMTIILDADGVITFTKEGSVTHAQLEDEVKSALGK